MFDLYLSFFSSIINAMIPMLFIVVTVGGLINFVMYLFKRG